MAKRNASNQLNHENWADEDEREEAGTFDKAPEEVLKSRVIRTAKRRNIVSSEETDASKKLFSGFSGFVKPAATSAPFSFLAGTNASSPKTNGLTNEQSAFKPPSVTSNSFTFKPIENAEQTKLLSNSSSVSDDNLTEYYSKLRGLNESVSKWIKTHVDSNPLCILTPVFRDYEKHLEEIEKEKGKTTSVQSESETKLSPTNTFKPVSTFLPSADKKAETPFTSFAPPATGFSFSSSAPFSFSNVTKPDTPASKEEDDESDEPPKAEFVPVVEEGHVFTKRCKVFVKKDDTYGDRGVGQLFLKPVSGSEKMQLIVRADTNLGNLLLNVLLTESIPLKRMGKNNVMLICVPTPEMKPPPVSVLLRVKTSEEADELLAILEKHRK